MKKTIALILALVFVLFLVACGGAKTNSDNNKGKSGSSSNSIQNKDLSELTYEEIYSIVSKALKKDIDGSYSAADPNKTTFRITGQEKSGDYLKVYGTLTLHDKYGDLTSSPYKTFEVKIDKTGKVAINNVTIRDKY